jgi:hypothetical protein
MNLIQVQDRLKDMPTQAIMSYANGSNPDVPPYLALGELNRRKQMEQKHAEAPQGTVKDQIEQSVKLAQAQKAAQAQGQQKMTEAMGAQQSPVPGGTPQPQEQPEAGIAQLPTGPMNFRDGGIVSFDGENASLVDQNMPSDEESQFMKDLRKMLPGLSPQNLRLRGMQERAVPSQDALKRQAAGPVGYFSSSADEFARAKADALAAERNPQGSSATAASELAAASAFENQGAPAKALPPTTQRPPSSGGGRAPGGAPQAGGPQAGAPAPENIYDMLAKRSEARTTNQPELPEDLRKKMAAGDLKYLNTEPGSKLEELYTQIAKRDEEDRARFLKNEEERKQGRLNRGLMAGAEATRGRGGLGALGSFFMGYGKAGEMEDEAARTRTDAQRKMEREQEVLRATVLAGVEDAKRLGHEGRFKAQSEALAKVAEANNKLDENKLAMLVSVAQAKEAQRHNLTDEEYKKAQLRYSQIAANKGPEIQQVFRFLSEQFPKLDPKAVLDMSLQYSGVGARQEAANTAAITKADAAFKAANQLEIIRADGEKDPAKKKKLEDDLEVKRDAYRKTYKDSGGIGGLNTSAPLPGGKVEQLS